MADKIGPGVFISELLADNAGGSAIDTDGDGRATKADEFIELQSTSGSPVNLDGYQIWTEKLGLVHTFGPGDVLNPGQTVTVVGEYTGTPPPGFFEANGITLGTNGNFLPDGENTLFDTIFLVDGATGEFAALSYGDPPRTPTFPSGFTGTTQSGSGEAISSNAPNGAAFSRDANGNLIEGPPTPGTPDVPCFVAGTRIETSRGWRLVEDLVPGDLLITRDNGPQPILATRAWQIGPRALAFDPGLRPVALPTPDGGHLHLSPAHRVLITDPRYALMFGSAEMLAAAHLVAGPGRKTQSVRYIHLLLERHELIHADGLWVESLFTGDVFTRARGGFQRWQLGPDVTLEGIRHRETVRPVLRGSEYRLIGARPLQRA